MEGNPLRTQVLQAMGLRDARSTATTVDAFIRQDLIWATYLDQSGWPQSAKHTGGSHGYARAFQRLLDLLEPNVIPPIESALADLGTAPLAPEDFRKVRRSTTKLLGGILERLRKAHWDLCIATESFGPTAPVPAFFHAKELRQAYESARLMVKVYQSTLWNLYSF